MAGRPVGLPFKRVMPVSADEAIRSALTNLRTAFCSSCFETLVVKGSFQPALGFEGVELSEIAQPQEREARGARNGLWTAHTLQRPAALVR